MSKAENNNHSTFFAVCACFFLSGLAALLYQTAWMRQFSTVFGTSELAVATVLSAYMGGLAFGAAVAGKYINHAKRPVLTYGILEAAIALSALLVPVLLIAARTAYAQILGGQETPPDASGLGQSLFYFVVAFIVLAIPTACMGATLPLLTRYAVTNDQQIGSRVGALYAINTIGAVFGTIIAAFVLLPAFGLLNTVWFGVVINFIVFIIAVYIAKSATSSNASDTKIESSESSVSSTEQTREEPPFWMNTRFILPIMLLSGVTSFVYEVLWTRLLSHILGGSVAAFATMLASFLAGIAIGSAIASRIAVTSKRSVYAFVIAQLGIALTSIAIYHSLHLVIPQDSGLSGNIGIAILILLPATLFIGATFPLAVRIYTDHAIKAASSSAQVYSWNTVGAIVGATVAGFFLIPALKYEGTIKIVILLNVFLGFLATLVLIRTKTWLSGALAIVFLALALVYKPSMPEQILRTSPITNYADGEIMYYEVGRSSTVLMTRNEGSIGLRNNGLPEAGTALKGSPPLLNTQELLSTLPAIIRPDAKSMLIVGLGGGNAVNGIPPSVEEIDVIELEPEVIEANKIASEFRTKDPLLDPRLLIYINDARSALSLTDKKYDAIISQPSHPWTAGASHLYTREYMSLAAEHLSEDGVFLQWMAGQFISESLFRSLCATMLDVFEHIKVYHFSQEVLFFVVSQTPIEPELELTITNRPVADNPVFYYQRGIVSAEQMLAGLLLDTQGAQVLAKDAPLLTDNFNRMATESAQARQSDSQMKLANIVKLLQPYVPVLNSNSWVHTQLENINYAYISEQYEKLKMRPFSIALAETLEQKQNWQSLLLTGRGLAAQGDQAESLEVLKSAYDLSRNNTQSNQATYALIEPSLDELALGQADEELQKIASELNGSAAAVLAAREAAFKQDWVKVASNDNFLAQSKPTDPWFLEATKLMVEWRNQLARSQQRNDLANEAWQIIDLAIAVHPVPDLYALRVSAAYLADRPNEVIETARRLAYIINAEVERVKEDNRLTEELSNLRLRQVAVIKSAVDDVSKRHEINPQTLREVLSKLDEATESLN